MGTELRCRDCDYVLFVFDEVPSDILWYPRLRHRLGGDCPKCGHKLPHVSKYASKMQLEVKSAIPVLTK